MLKRDGHCRRSGLLCLPLGARRGNSLRRTARLFGTLDGLGDHRCGCQVGWSRRSVGWGGGEFADLAFCGLCQSVFMYKCVYIYIIWPMKRSGPVPLGGSRCNDTYLTPGSAVSTSGSPGSTWPSRPGSMRSRPGCSCGPAPLRTRSHCALVVAVPRPLRPVEDLVRSRQPGWIVSRGGRKGSMTGW